MPDVLAAHVRAIEEAERVPPSLDDRARALRVAQTPVGPTPEDLADRANLLLQGGLTAEAIEVLSRGDSTAWSPARMSLLGVAYLRLGEQANCLAADHAPEVCILPFRASAIHADPGPARRASALFRRVLAADSTQMDARWLLNIAHQALGEYPEGVPPRFVIPGLDAPAGGGFPRLENVAPDRGVAGMGLSGGVALDDFDGDGDLDLITTSWGPSDPIRYFANDGRGGFTEQTRAAGLNGLTGGLNLIHGDIDNDGDLDVYAVMGGAFDGDTFPNALFENPGSDNAWVTLRLEGVRSPRTPIGARVALVVEDADGSERTIHRMVSTGGSFGANSLQLEVGLGAATRLVRVEIRWPAGGAVEVLKDLELRRIHAIREGDGSSRLVDQPRIQLRRAPVAGHAHHHGD
jgi:hypothetical protein